MQLSQAQRPARLARKTIRNALMTPADNDLADPFDILRPRLFGIAYRMLSVRADAEDVLQNA